MDHRYYGRKKTLQYLLKWKGYPESDNTWESADQVHTPELVKEYHRQKPLKHIRRSFIPPQTASCLKNPFPSSNTTTTLQHQSCLTLSSPPPTRWSNLAHLLNHLTQSEGRTCPPYPYPSNWPLHPRHIHPSLLSIPTPLHHSRSTQTSLPITPHNTYVDLPMKGHVLSPSIANWNMTQLKTPCYVTVGTFTQRQLSRSRRH